MPTSYGYIAKCYNACLLSMHFKIIIMYAILNSLIVTIIMNTAYVLSLPSQNALPLNLLIADDICAAVLHYAALFKVINHSTY